MLCGHESDALPVFCKALQQELQNHEPKVACYLPYLSLSLLHLLPMSHPQLEELGKWKVLLLQ
jgi:hypothetical protein